MKNKILIQLSDILRINIYIAIDVRSKNVFIFNFFLNFAEIYACVRGSFFFLNNVNETINFNHKNFHSMQKILVFLLFYIKNYLQDILQFFINRSYILKVNFGFLNGIVLERMQLLISSKKNIIICYLCQKIIGLREIEFYKTYSLLLIL